MKKVLILIFLAIGFISIAQETEVVYGTVRTDGYNYITKGAFWVKRPESKTIYEGGKVDGFINHRLKAEHYVRFVEGEHNKLDRNYIVFPKGEMVYENTQGEIFSAKCGNKIEFIRPVDMVRIVEIEKTVEVFKTDTVIHKHVFDTIVHKHVFDDKFTPLSSLFKSFEFKPEKKKWYETNLAKIGGGLVGGALLTYGGYKLYKWLDYKKGGPAGAPSYPAEDEGGPAGAPSYPADEGGPAGAPGYGANGFGFSFSF